VTVELLSLGWTVRTFEADGDGGRALEVAASRHEFEAVIELSLTELAAELLDTGFGAGPDRLTTAADLGLPQIIALGGLDAAQASHPSTDRQTFCCDQRHYWRTSTVENDRLGQLIAFFASAANAATTIVFPRGGLSVLDAPGAPFWHPQADAALFESLRNWLAPNVKVVETAAHVNSAECAAAIVEAFSDLWSPPGAISSSSRP
jgi:uncharacterized protein (UPF0261 family)